MNKVILNIKAIHLTLKTLCFVMIVISNGIILNAKENSEIPLAQVLKVNSKILNEDRYALIHTPKDYGKKNNKYPVIYLLDGDTHLSHVSGVVEFLSLNKLIPEMIVVAITNTDRVRDFTPELKLKNDNLPTAGGADNFRQFISQELMPVIEKNYRTEPYKILIGHSFGGLFAVYDTFHSPNLFNATISISPTLWWNEKSQINKAKKDLDKSAPFNRFLYLSMANERQQMQADVQELQSILKKQAPVDFKWHFESFPNESHSSTHHLSTYNGLKQLFQNWKIMDPYDLFDKKGLAGINQHYVNLTQQYGYEIKPLEWQINDLGYYLLEQDKKEIALNLFLKNVDTYPESINAQDSLADAYLNLSNFKSAQQTYIRACSLAHKYQHEGKDWFCNRVKEVAIQISEKL